MPSANVADALGDMARAAPDRPALFLPRVRRGAISHHAISYAALDRASRSIAAGLATLGLGRGSRVALFVPPSRAFFALSFGLLKMGAAPVWIDPGMGAKGVGRCLADANPAGFVAVPRAILARRLLGWAPGAVAVTAGRWRLGAAATLNAVEARGQLLAERTDWPQVAPSDVAAVLFTSGSTGPAKGAVYTHGMFAAQVGHLKQMYRITPGEVDLCSLPLFALFGPALGMSCAVPLLDPRRPATADPAKLVAQCNQLGVTNLFASPAVLRNWATAGARLPRVPTLKRVVSAGSPATTATIAGVAALLPAGARVFTPYGATEALPVSDIGSGEILLETAAKTALGAGVCVGRPVPGVEVRIVRQTAGPIPTWADAELVPDGEIGEFVAGGAAVSQSYWNRPDADAAAKILDPAAGRAWHRMGDVGYRDTLGRLWFCGRKAHVVWTDSGPLYPDQVEPIFAGLEWVERAALVGVRRGGRAVPVVCVEWARGALHRLDFRAACRARAAESPHTQTIRCFLHYPRPFPVDVRHNSKVNREQLAAWADRHLPANIPPDADSGAAS